MNHINLYKITGVPMEIKKATKYFFELDQATGMLKHLPLNGAAPVELRQKNERRRPISDF
ncbi:hypothetical protein GCM10020331_102780 [Ectobacillus funiculus]